MKSRTLSRSIVVLTCAVAFLFVLGSMAFAGGAREPVDDGVFRIAMLLPGSIDDGGWNQAAHRGLIQLRDGGYTTSFTEGVQVASIDEALRNYAESGYNLVIGHGFQFGEPALRVSASFPDTYFFVSGLSPADAVIPRNVGFINQKEFEAAYLSGVLAAMETETGRIGYVGGLEIPSQLANLAAFTTAVQNTNPSATVNGIMTGTFGDPALGQEAAIALIEGGVDIIMHTADSTGLGVIEAAIEHNIRLIGYGSDQSSLAPELMMTSLVPNMTQAIVNQVGLIEAGNFGGLWNAGIGEGIIDIAPIASFVSANTQETVLALREQIAAGEFQVPEIYERID